MTDAEETRDGPAAGSSGFPAISPWLLLDAAPNFVGIADGQGRLIYLNPVARDWLGIGRDESIHELTIADTLTPREGKRILEEVIPRISASDDARWSGETEFRSRDGAVVPVLLSGMLHFSGSGELLWQASLAYDLRERKVAEHALHESEVRNRALVEAIPDLIFRVAEDGTFVDFEGSSTTLPALRPEQFLGKRISEVLPPPIANQMIEVMARTLRTGEVETLSYQLPSGDRLSDFEARAVKSSEREVVWIARDVTEQRRAADEVKRLSEGLKQLVEQRTAELEAEIAERRQVEVALRESEARYRAYLEQSPYGIYVVDAQGSFVEVNRTASEQTGYHAEELRAKTIADVVAPEAVAQALDDFRTLTRKGAIYAEYPCIARSGARYWVSVHASKVGDGSFLAFTRDITEQKHADDARRELEIEREKVARLSSIGTLAGGIAHDFNNYLTGILGYIELSQHFFTHRAEEKALDALAHAIEGCRQSQRLTQQLLTFAKGGAPIKSVVDLRQRLQKTCSFVLSGSNTRFECDVDPELWPIEADEGQINQVIQNILINADQAMPAGGAVTIVASNVELDDERVPLEPGRYVKIAISDQGPGIEAEHRVKIFEPYFTTKKHGSGLGLATTYSIVRKHGGYVKVDSLVGHGTTFEVLLPATEGVASDDDAPGDELSECRGRILVMDDDLRVLSMIANALSAEGHRVVGVRDGNEALSAFEEAWSEGQRFDLVILDLTIPGGVGGVATLERLRRIDPRVKAVVASGYSTDAVLANARQHGFDDVLSKPFRIARLSAVVQRLLTENDATLRG